jgi:hypothetical protein
MMKVRSEGRGRRKSGQIYDPAALPPGRNPFTHWIRGWVGPRIGLDVLEEGKNFLPLLEFEPQTGQPVTQPLYRLRHRGYPQSMTRVLIFNKTR